MLLRSSRSSPQQLSQRSPQRQVLGLHRHPPLALQMHWHLLHPEPAFGTALQVSSDFPGYLVLIVFMKQTILLSIQQAGKRKTVQLT